MSTDMLATPWEVKTIKSKNAFNTPNPPSVIV